MNLTPPGGMSDIGALVVGINILVTVIVTIIALRRAIKAGEAVWYLLIFLIPLVGAVLTIVTLDKSGKRRRQGKP